MNEKKSENIAERKAETITIGGGVQYAKVVSRCTEFHKDNDKCCIETTCEFKEGFVLFSAKVTTKKGTFTGHSMDKVSGRQKQFEKQETIAVGRALAFAGYLATGEIACAEEMAAMSQDSERMDPEQIALLTEMAVLAQVDVPKVLKHFKVKALADIPYMYYKELMTTWGMRAETGRPK